jgi:hypothetical protein
MFVLLAALPALGACGGDETAPADDGEESQCDADGCDCPSPLTLRPDGKGCVEMAPEQECAPGTMAALGARECRPVGWIAPCPQGMQPDASGWGCTDVQPDAPCAGATMEVLGQPTCQPIGNCDAQFPPAGASLFVDDDYAAAELDGAHFATIGEALAAASPGAIVAVEAGTYVESLQISEDAVTLAGRCAAEVVVQSPDGGAPGVKMVSVDGAVVRGLTLRGHKGAVALMYADATVEECLIEDSIIAGVIAVASSQVAVKRSRVVGTVQLGGDFGQNLGVEDGSSADVTDSAFVQGTANGLSAMGEGSHLSVTRSIVRDTRSNGDGEFGKGLAAASGATVSVVESAFTNNRCAHMAAHDAGTSISVARSVLRNVVPDIDGLPGGSGVELDGASIDVIDTAIVGSAGNALVAFGAGTLRARSSVVRGPMGAESWSRGGGALAAEGSSLEITDSALIELRDIGILVQDPASHGLVQGSLVRAVRMTPETIQGDGYGMFVGFGAAAEVLDSAFLDHDRVGILLGGFDVPTQGHSFAHIARTLVAGSRTDPNGHFGRGVEVFEAAELVLEQSAVVDHVEAGINVGMPGTRATVTASVVRGTRVDQLDHFGHGVLAQQGADLTLQDTYVLDNGAVGLIFSGSSGRVAGALVAANVVGIHAQDGSMLEEVDNLPGAAAPLMVRVTSTSRFVGNASRVGSGFIPVPSPISE